MVRAVVSGNGRGAFTLSEVPDPSPALGEALVQVDAFTVNFGEIHGGLTPPQAGTVPGWEAAGVVVRAARDGSGPREGTPVLTLGVGGGWAELRAVPAHLMAPLSDGADLGAASTVGIAGASALRAIRRLGDVRGRRVLVTGATGGVGRFAVQLLRDAGAVPVAATRKVERRRAELIALGAAEVVPDPATVDGPVHGVVDTVGGDQLVSAYGLLAEGSVLVMVGHSSEQDVVFPYGSLLGGPGTHDRTLTSFFLLSTTPDLGDDLRMLADRVAAGELDPGIAWRGPWQSLSEATTAMLDRTLHGKAVVEVR
ncbi:zinc-binding dehydrogenase [Prauserella rugosa]|uniref:NADPH:quinone reductase-like Zn-dependent oxidoreductase n=1 Tax=Prauserella rugosa TaxID=43354 RepID=A0A660CAT9_9PSEU|nr:zinc-binding dehydrogenase [Prauserella rugosa]TWH18873.1 NADPH:quinone reductase-like Zn-dependent oxidoreductase [Prauserella rugosa]